MGLSQIKKGRLLGEHEGRKLVDCLSVVPNVELGGAVITSPLESSGYCVVGFDGEVYNVSDKKKLGLSMGQILLNYGDDCRFLRHDIAALPRSQFKTDEYIAYINSSNCNGTDVSRFYSKKD